MIITIINLKHRKKNERKKRRKNKWENRKQIEKKTDINLTISIIT